MATGFAIANTILIEAPEGAIVVDVTESIQAAEKTLEALRKVSKSPVKAIIYTHNHPDHVYEAEVKIYYSSTLFSIFLFRPFDVYNNL